MIYVLLNDDKIKYEVNELIKLFTASKEIEFIDEKTLADSQSFLLYCQVDIEGRKFELKLLKEGEVKTSVSSDGLKITAESDYRTFKNTLKNKVFGLMVQVFDYHPHGGILTGIRPSKVVNELIDKGVEKRDIEKILHDDYSFAEEKIKLLMMICDNERKILDYSDEKEVSIYVGIPFCPSKCSYCSFTSYKANDLQIEAYLEKLKIEIEGVAHIIKSRGFRIETVYIGGGTPTTLSAEQLNELINTIRCEFDLSDMKEFTVECGRPDTITFEKLQVLKKQGVERISINPQTMKEETLKAIGRAHKAKDIEESYNMARAIGFSSINMDAIIGLPDETPLDYEESLSQIITMRPENITVHTLALKTNSKLKIDGEYDVYNKENYVEQMLGITEKKLKDAGYKPYYMYRQKYMAGNYENVGYCLDDKECIYNIRIIEEKQTIIALGAGGVSKAFYPKENRFERIPNVNNHEVYNQRVEEMIERKKRNFYYKSR